RKTLVQGGPALRAVAASPDERTVATTGDEGAIILWETATWKERLRFPNKATPHWGLALTFAPDGRTLAFGGSDHIVRLHDVLTGAVRAQTTGHNEQVHCVAFSRDGRRLASIGPKHTALVQDITGLLTEPRPGAARLTEKDPAGLWAKLSSEDARE